MDWSTGEPHQRLVSALAQWRAVEGKHGAPSCRSIAANHDIPWTVFQTRVRGKRDVAASVGPRLALSVEGEKKMSTYIFEMADMGKSH